MSGAGTTGRSGDSCGGVGGTGPDNFGVGSVASSAGTGALSVARGRSSSAVTVVGFVGARKRAGADCQFTLAGGLLVPGVDCFGSDGPFGGTTGAAVRGWRVPANVGAGSGTTVGAVRMGGTAPGVAPVDWYQFTG